jgi:hypothetical protein
MARVGGSEPFRVSILSVHFPRGALRGRRNHDLIMSMSWDDVVWRKVLEGNGWDPHSLHTAEATGRETLLTSLRRPSAGKHSRSALTGYHL